MNVFKYAFADFRRQKSRTFFAVAGIAISIFLLTSVAIINDSMSYSYINQATNEAGASDIVITKALVTNVNFDPFYDQNILDPYMANLTQVAHWYPRLLLEVNAYNEKATNVTGNTIFYGVNIVEEGQYGDLGTLNNVYTSNGSEGGVWTGSIPAGHCIVTYNCAKEYNISVGDSLHCTYTRYSQDFIVDAIVVQNLRFSFVESNLIITDLPVAQQFAGLTGKINDMMATLENPQQVYDARDTAGTINRLRNVGQQIQEVIGFSYSVTLPKMSELQTEDYINMGMSIAFWLITTLSMLISGILINSILTTSVEERVREFGIFRTVGGRRTFNLELVMLQGFIISILGTTIGILLSLVAVPIILPAVMSSFRLWTASITFYVNPQTILLSTLIGISITLGVSALPAVRTARVKIIEAIQPFRHGSGEYTIKKEGSANTKTILVGVAIATIGGILFVIFPQVLTSGDLTLILGVFIGLLMAILLGLVFASVGIIPGIEQGFTYIFKPFVARYHGMIQTSLRRYQRRNTSTILMFAIAFAFIFFVTTRLELQTQNVATNLTFQYGSDLVLVNQGTEQDGNALTKNLEDKLLTIPGVQGTAIALYNTFDIQTILSFFNFDTGQLSISSSSLGGLGGGGGMGGLFGGGSSTQSTQQQTGGILDQLGLLFKGNKNQIYAGDLVDFNQEMVGVVAVDQRYVDMANPALMTWEGGSSAASFNKVFANNNSVIISSNIAALFQKGVGDQVRVRCYNHDGSQELNNTNQVFNVAGVTGGLPGFWNFRTSSFSDWDAGFLVNINAYCNLMDWNNTNQANMVVDKIFVQLSQHDQAFVRNVENQINIMLGNSYKYLLSDPITLINMAEQQNQTMETLMTVVLFFTVVICLFGLLSAMYSTILERTLEVGIIRALGMKRYQVRRMFLAESMITMLSAGLMGTVIGSTVAYLLDAQTAILTEVPQIFIPPWNTIFIVFFAAVGLGTLGMYGVLRGLMKQSIMDIFRKTF